jgi:acyl-CoA synthetase (NDP forming)
MDLSRLVSPRFIAVVGATPREQTYAHETLRNLEVLGYPGDVWGAHPGHANPLDETAPIWGETATLAETIATVGADDAIDQPAGPDAAIALEAVARETLAGAAVVEVAA